MNLTNEVYNVLKQLAQVILPALATLYFAIAPIWALPYAKQVVGTITAVDAFLGVALSLLARGYSPPTDGKLVVDKTSPVKDTYSLVLTSALAAIDGKNAITLGVEHVPMPPAGTAPTMSYSAPPGS